VHEDTPNLLPPNVFGFEFDNELRRVVRSGRVLTVVTIGTDREVDGVTASADDRTVRSVAEAVGKEVRDTDLVGCTDNGIVVVLIDAHFAHSTMVIERLVSRMESCGLPEDVRLAIGAASYPMHGTDRATLQSQALSRPLTRWHPPRAPRVGSRQTAAP
jgi:hypothetical protein